MKQNYLFVMFCTLVLLTGCKSGDDSITPEDNKSVSTGTVEGKVLAKNGTKPIGGALVFTIDNKNQVYHTYSNADGTFSLAVPEGNTTLHIQTGNGLNFRSEVAVSVKKNETTSVADKDSKLNQVAKIAYVEGSYDEIESIIANLGYTATQISYHDLKNLNTISQYDIIFLNCGSRNLKYTGTNTPGNDLDVFANLSTFITNGGSIYSSDWAAAYLVGGDKSVLSCGPSAGFIDFTQVCFSTTGSIGMYNNSSISNAAMASSLGFNTLDIMYDQPLWEQIKYYDPSFWEVLVQKGSEALMLRTNKYANKNAPKIAIGTSLNKNHMTICHKTANGNTITMTINQNAWSAHQAHGDYVGSCTGNTTSGNIYYTTFHNHASGNIGKTGPILEYVILNL